ncbi:hypothetical protein F2P56_024553 [Juglans regia]|uniref:Reverse transcriptase n=2 Tax=Juglans regia TaxID=51240 RepID=A0A833U726_JUGRE|nr:uncharacterized protein LOC108997257 [Juglans regia]KAF5454924.1 hypothetical protein F2P56_024553 [Juglans regia]
MNQLLVGCRRSLSRWRINSILNREWAIRDLTEKLKVLEEKEGLESVGEVKKRRQRNTIKSIRDSQGRLVQRERGLEDAFSSYFKVVFLTSNPIAEEIEIFVQCVEGRVTVGLSEKMEREFTAVEVGEALRQMSAFKLPDLDGFGAGFYKGHWNVVGEDTCRAVLSVLNGGEMSQGLSHTLISLIPKIKALVSVKEYRPISLCNVLYKLIPKVVANSFKEEWRVVYSLLEVYEKASGQTLNKDKTSIFYGANTPTDMRGRIFQETGAVVCDSYEKNLGLSTVVGRLRYNVFRSIKERVWLKIQNWKNSFFSRAGKEVLIKAVLQAIPTYTMNVFQLPKKLCKEIEALMARFWWASYKKEKGIHWKQWRSLELAKAEGGLGFRDLECFNNAMLAKQGWRLLKEPHSLLAKVFKDKYLKNLQLLEAPLGNSPSLIWKSIWSNLRIVKEDLIWRIGDGRTTCIWGQKWLPTPTTHCVQSPVRITQKDAKVCELIDEQKGVWKENVVGVVFSEEEAKVMYAILVSQNGVADKLIWNNLKKGVFTVKSAYYMEKQK